MAQRKRRTLGNTDSSQKSKPTAKKPDYQKKVVNKFIAAVEILGGMSGGSLLQNGVNSMLEQSGGGSTPTTGIDGKKIVVNLITIGLGLGGGMMYDNPHVDNISTGLMLSGMKDLGKTVIGQDLTNISFSQKQVAAKTEDKKPLGNYNETELTQLPDDFFLDGTLEGEMEGQEGSDFAEEVEFETGY